MRLFILSLISYLIGCINPAFLIGKKHGIDIRTVGSHNAGMSNAIIAFGKWAGIATGIFDIMKSFLCFKYAQYAIPEIACAGMVCGCCCLLGHIFPFCLKFHGGKGFASLSGIILAFNVKVFLMMLIVAIVIAVTAQYLCIVTTYAAASFPIIYGFSTHDVIGAVLIGAIGVIIICKHIENFKRIPKGMECRLSGIFNREKEEERIRINTERYSHK